jgi:hypothetical protein
MRKALDLPYDAWSTIDGQSNSLRVSRATRHKHLIPNPNFVVS